MTKTLITAPNISDHDDVYQLIIDMHRGMTDEESQSANAKLILTLVNHVGDINLIREATDIARESILAWRDKE
jgi:Protein of unknown function (DUF2783)|tara:strand:- start:1014 stop:1232 length:219 start_codon:yes stop_codon:yes gene_type:complete